MVRVLLLGQIMMFIQVNGKMIIKMGLVFLSFLMEIDMKDNLKKIKNMDLANIIQTRAMFSMVFLRMMFSHDIFIKFCIIFFKLIYLYINMNII